MERAIEQLDEWVLGVRERGIVGNAESLKIILNSLDSNTLENLIKHGPYYTRHGHHAQRLINFCTRSILRRRFSGTDETWFSFCVINLEQLEYN